MNKKRQKGLLHQSFYKEKKKGQFISVTYGDQYFADHQITLLLKKAIEHIVKSGSLPQNPYACLIRLLTINSVEDSLTTYFSKEKVEPLEVKSQNRKNTIEQIKIGQLSLYTSHQLASQVEINFVAHLEPIIKTNRLNLNCEFYTAVCGIDLLKCKFVKYTGYSKNRLVFKNYIPVGKVEEGAEETFSKIVYNTVQEILSAKDSYFCCLGFEHFYSFYHSDEIWNRTQIALYKTKLINHLCTFPFEGEEVYIKYYKKYQGQYIEIRQKFLPVFEHQQNVKCSQLLALQGYFKGGFLSRQGAQFYLNLYQKQSQGDYNKLFLDQNSSWIMWFYHEQNLDEIMWSLFYQVIVKRKDSYDILADIISSALCSPIAQISHYLNQLKTLINLIQLKINSTDIQSIFGLVCIAIRQNLNQGYNAELISIKDYLVKLCERCSSSEYFKENKDPQSELEVLHIMNKIVYILDAATLNYKQHLIGFNQSFMECMKDIMNSYNMKEFSVTLFGKLFGRKSKSQVIVVENQIENVMETFKVKEDKARDIVLINYYQETKLKENIYNYLLEVCFEVKPAYPLPLLILRLIQYMIEYAYKELKTESIKHNFSKSNKIDQMIVEDTNVYGIGGNLPFYSYSFLKILKHMNLFQIQQKGATVIYSISGKLLIEQPRNVNINQNTLSLDIDILVKNKLQESIESFYSIIINKLKQLDKKRNVGVVGFFNNQRIVRNFDLKNIPSLLQFKRIISLSKSIVVKCILNDHHLKIIELVFNLHYIADTWKHLKEIDKFWESNRVFFERKHLALWGELYSNIKLGYYNMEKDDILNIDLALKKWSIESSRKHISKPHILKYYCESTLQLARESFNLGLTVEYMKIDRTGKFQLQVLRQNFKSHGKDIRKLITEYGYTYFEGLSITLLQTIILIEDYFKLHKSNNGEETELIWLQEHFNRIGNILNSTSQLIILLYRNYVKYQKGLAFIY